MVQYLPRFQIMWASCAIAMALLVSGCGSRAKADYSTVTLVKVSGQVLLDGQPVSGAAVIFEDLKDGSQSYGITDSNGLYSLRFDSQTTGVKVGEKQVRIGTSPLLVGRVTSEEVDPDAAESDGDEKVPACYNRESMLKVNLTASQTMNWDLTQNCTTRGPK